MLERITDGGGVTTRSRKHPTVNQPIATSAISKKKKEPKAKPKAKRLAVLKIKKPEVFELGEIVYAKLSGFPPWPGFIKEVFFAKTYLIEFFGDQTEQFFKAEALSKFANNDAIGKAHKHKKGYNKALCEAKALCKKAKK